MKTPYRFLPFRFERHGSNVLLVNDVGEYLFLPESIFTRFVRQELEDSSPAFMDLKAKAMLWVDHLPEIVDLQATKYRTKKRFLYDFTSLHMFVVTQRCNQKCLYCHAYSTADDHRSDLDMDLDTARKCVELVFQSPSKNTKIEFQGGEPLLNFPIVEEIIEYALELNTRVNKRLEFVVCTNLLALDRAKLDYLAARDIYLSTSLDGPRELHDTCRKSSLGGGTYDLVSERLHEVIKVLGRDRVSALMTVTAENIDRLSEVIDEYLRLNLGGIFIRSLNPLGRAHWDWATLGYSVSAFVQAYAEALDYIIRINLTGVHFPEQFATLILTKILTPYSTGFVDLQSPAGTGISGVIYDYNGDVYVSDEARMIARTTGSKRFCLGNVHSNSWQEMFSGGRLKEIISASCIEALPGCAWCVFQPYCGGDPVRNYFLYGDMISNQPTSSFCQKSKAIFRLLFNYLRQKEPSIEDVFWAWITCRSIEEIQGKPGLESPNEVFAGCCPQYTA
jgi:His-Xaa-Ser system radical SAM maturase HxsB